MVPHLRVLIVEDSTFFREMFKGVLHSRFPSIEIDGAADPAEALQKSETLLPALIFIDVELPGENGFKLAEKIKAQHPSATIVILTAHDLPEYRDAALQQGYYFLSKGSSTRNEIFRLVESVLSSRG
ncbi:MAG: response regulator [Deltaproteobacteria bacterium]|nr:MAG: response regulator [Deltaproteobacteria bacterium]